MIAEIDIGKAFKGNTAGILFLSYGQRGTAIAVSGCIDSFWCKEQDRHGTLDHLLRVEQAIDQTLLLVDDRSRQLGGIDPPAAHFHKVDMSVLESMLD